MCVCAWLCFIFAHVGTFLSQNYVESRQTLLTKFFVIKKTNDYKLARTFKSNWSGFLCTPIIISFITSPLNQPHHLRLINFAVFFDTIYHHHHHNLNCHRGGRVTEVDLCGDVGAQVLADNIVTAPSAALLVPCSRADLRKRGAWAELFKYRTLVKELFVVSGGFLLHQVSFAVQVRAFLVHVQLAATPGGV